MAFWTSRKIRAALQDDLITQPGNSEPAIDGNAVKLTIGREVYISPSESVDRAPGEAIIQLTRGKSFTIPSGQFAFLTTEETVKIPPNAMAFINIRSQIKFRGLVNVSGFHVDPGYWGQLTFSVFNAGPQPITLRHGQEAFHMWFADLIDDVDGKEPNPRESKTPQKGIDPNKLNAIAGEVHSFKGLMSQMKDAEKKLTERLHSVERDHAVLKWALTLIIGLLIGLLIRSFSMDISKLLQASGT